MSRGVGVCLLLYFGPLLGVLAQGDHPVGFLFLSVHPYPASVYENAPAHTTVLTVTGYDNETRNQLDNLTLSKDSDAMYFTLRHQSAHVWVVETDKTIDKPVNYTFHFRVMGFYSDLVQDTTVIITVTERNMFPPTFESSRYDFVAYDRSFEEGVKILGAVKAHDNDTEDYNSHFEYRILDRSVTDIFSVMSGGQIEILGPFPPGVSRYIFNVTAIDTGSPQKYSMTSVHVKLTHLKAPDTFCVSVDGVKARICWKDPTNGSFVEKYQLQISMNGQNVKTHPVTIRGKKNEVCTSVTAPTSERSYRFTIRVFNESNFSPESVERFVNITKNGLYGECKLFSECSILQPCQNGGTCRTNPDLSFTCDCKDGFIGQNCTDTDPCVPNPCYNNGTCLSVPDSPSKCACPSGFSGDHCQHVDNCATNPCKNGGTCYTANDGSPQCDCSDDFLGDLCEIVNPCSSMPCKNGGSCSHHTNGSYVCACSPGFSGNQCDSSNICIVQNPCLHQGVCSSTGNGTFSCQCATGFMGKTCKDKDPCASLKCLNNGTCQLKQPGTNVSECVCQEHYSGNLCEIYDYCHSKPCVNGTCSLDSVHGFKCTCNAGFVGAHCDQKDPCGNNPCQHGGSCTNVNDTYICDCVTEHYGRHCEFMDGCKADLCENGAQCTAMDDQGDVDCACPEGYLGKFCQFAAPCLSSPCVHASGCTDFEYGYYECMCTPGWVGRNCDTRDPCLSSPCQNNGQCSYHEEAKSFRCDCPQFFHGKSCDKYDFCNQNTNMCRNNASCLVTDSEIHQVKIKDRVANVSTWYACTCPYGYTGLQCEVQIDPCMLTDCGNGGRCVSNGRLHYCICRDNSIRKHCRDEKCIQDTTYHDKTGRYRWPTARPNTNVSLPCPYGGHDHDHLVLPMAWRACHLNPDTGRAEWGHPITTACRSISVAEADFRLRQLLNLTGDAAHLTAEELANITYALENLVIYAFHDSLLGQEVMQIVSNILEAREAVLLESNHRNHSSERLVEMIDDFTKEVDTADKTEFDTKNVNIMIVNFTKPENAPRYRPAFRYQPKLDPLNKTEKMDVSMMLPAEVFENTNKKNLRLEFVAYRSSSFFLPDNAPSEYVMHHQKVLTAKVHGLDVDHLDNPVEYTIDNINDDEDHTCVFWDENNDTWSSRGVVTVETGGSKTLCHSYHLTSFAVLLDPKPEPLSQAHDIALTSLSYIGCAISIFGLAFTILTFSMFRSLNRERSGKILLNMCVSMLMLNISYILMAETSRSEDTLCVTVAVLLHYFLLTTLVWMVTEAVNMYQAIITVFTKYSSYFILKRCVLAWGLPAVVVAVTMGVNSLDNYRSTGAFCFISQASLLAFYITLLGPACIILVVNTIIFVLVARVIMKPKFKGHSPAGEKQEAITPAQVRGAFTVMVLLGITWVFSPLAIDESKIVFYYLFTILNSLQGFLIFIFRCLFNSEVRSAWIMLVKTGKFKRRRGPVKSAHDSSSSKPCNHDNSKNNSHSFADSFNNTGKTYLSNNGNGWQKNHNILNNENFHCDEYKITKNGHSRHVTSMRHEINHDVNIQNKNKKNISEFTQF